MQKNKFLIDAPSNSACQLVYKILELYTLKDKKEINVTHEHRKEFLSKVALGFIMNSVKVCIINIILDMYPSQSWAVRKPHNQLAHLQHCQQPVCLPTGLVENHHCEKATVYTLLTTQA